MTDVWDEDRIAFLIKLHTAGHTSGEIVRKIYERFKIHVTRNAVIGKRTRLEAKKQIGVVVKLKPVEPSPKRPQKPRLRLVSPVALPTPPPTGPWRDFPAKGLCRWIHGHPGSEWRCCAAPVVTSGEPYCGFHERAGHNPEYLRRRNPQARGTSRY